MPLRVGINGYGRIGRMVCRAAFEHDAVEVVAINDLVPADNLAYLFQHDTLHGQFKGDVEVDGQELIIRGRRIKAHAERDKTKIPWQDHAVDYVVESTGLFTDFDGAVGHTQDEQGNPRYGGPRRVIVSAPTKTPDRVPTFVVGVNEGEFDPDRHTVVSNASCTTNCLAPLARVLHETVGIEEGLMSTVHSATSTQPTQDGPSKKDWRGGRNAYMNIIPSGTGAAKAVGLVLPALQGRLTGMAFRVPTANVSVVDLTVRTTRPTSYEQISTHMQEAADGPLHGILGCTEKEVVSSDFMTCPLSSIFDKGAGIGLNEHFFKLVSWYDNEWGYSNRVVDLMIHMARTEGLIEGPRKAVAMGA